MRGSTKITKVVVHAADGTVTEITGVGKALAYDSQIKQDQGAPIATRALMIGMSIETENENV